MPKKFSQILETIFTFLLFGSQTVLNAGWSISIMTFPLLPLTINYLLNLELVSWGIISNEISALFIYSSFIVGRIIALIGVIIFFVAAGQWIKNHRKKVGLFKTGLYAKVRHPQFTGIIITTLGLTIMSLTLEVPIYYPGIVFVDSDIPLLVGLWFLQVMGYLTIAKYEDRRLSKQFTNAYNEYRVKTPMLYPIKSPKRIPELLFTISLTTLICIILMLLPYDTIEYLSHNLYDFGI